jgi:hypothetical protein
MIDSVLDPDACIRQDKSRQDQDKTTKRSKERDRQFEELIPVRSQPPHNAYHSYSRP